VRWEASPAPPPWRRRPDIFETAPFAANQDTAPRPGGSTRAAGWVSAGLASAEQTPYGHAPMAMTKPSTLFLIALAGAFAPLDLPSQ